MILIVALAFSITMSQNEHWTSVRPDDGRRAVFLKTYGGNAETPTVGGHIYLAPGRGVATTTSGSSTTTAKREPEPTTRASLIQAGAILKES